MMENEMPARFILLSFGTQCFLRTMCMFSLQALLFLITQNKSVYAECVQPDGSFA